MTLKKYYYLYLSLYFATKSLIWFSFIYLFYELHQILLSVNFYIGILDPIDYLKQLEISSITSKIYNPIILFLIKFIFLYIFLTILRKFPISSKVIYNWISNNEISNILGKKICSHYRYYNVISNEQFIYLYSISKSEKMLLEHHNNNDFTKKIFEHFDEEYHKDIKN